MAIGPLDLKIEKGTGPVLILATNCHTTESEGRSAEHVDAWFVKLGAS